MQCAKCGKEIDYNGNITLDGRMCDECFKLRKSKKSNNEVIYNFIVSVYDDDILLYEKVFADRSNAVRFANEIKDFTTTIDSKIVNLNEIYEYNDIYRMFRKEVRDE